MSNDSPVVIYLQDKRIRFAERIQVIQDVASAVVLVPAALARFARPDFFHRAFASAELIAVAILAVLTIRELRDGDDEISGISWSNVVVGLILVAESLLQTHEGAKIGRPALVTGITSIVLGLVQSRMRHKRRSRCSLTITNTEVKFSLNKFRKFNFRWDDVTSITSDDREIRIATRSGKTHKVNLRRFDNAEEIRAALVNSPRRIG